MRIVLLILLASTAALAATALLVRPQPSQSAVPASERQARQLLAAAELRPSRGPAYRLPPPAGNIEPPSAGIMLPLMERSLPAALRSEPLDPGLIEAMDRIEPIIDPTRLEGPFVAPAFRIWPGTASPLDVFGEHWRLAANNPNVQRQVRSYALAWDRAGRLSCDDFAENRAHPAGAPALTGLTAADCRRVLARDGRRGDDAAPLPVVAAPLDLAIFAAPLPGARMSSGDFWAAQRERVEAARDRLRRRWQAARGEEGGIGLRD